MSNRFIIKLLAFLWAGLLFPTAGAFAADHRYILAEQDSSDGVFGYYLAFENSSGDANPCGLKGLHLIVGIGDGRVRRYFTVPNTWELGHEYEVELILGAAGTEVKVDGSTVKVDKRGFSPASGTTMAGVIPGWASGPADYLIRQSSLQIFVNGDSTKRLSIDFQRANSRPLALSLFQDGNNVSLNGVEIPKDSTTTVKANFILINRPELSAFSPYVDRYGQSIHANYPGKILTDKDLKNSAQYEEKRLKEWGQPKGYDQYGGNKQAGWKVKGTGFYSLAKKNGFWWLISPEGYPVFYKGLCTAPSPMYPSTPITGRESIFESLPTIKPAYSVNVWGDGGIDYVAFHTANLYRKYGNPWRQKTDDLTRQRIKAWGFSGIGKWGGLAGLPSMPVLNRNDVPNLIDHPDVFDEEVREQFKASLESQIILNKKDPTLIGWSLGNEYGEIIPGTEIESVLKLADAPPLKRALLDYAVDTLYKGSLADLSKSWRISPPENTRQLYSLKLKAPKKDIETLRQFYAGNYYSFIYKTIKSIDPNHLYCGFWIMPGWWENENDWRLITKNCDIIGYDRYNYQFFDDALKRLVDSCDKPVLLGEFSFPQYYYGERGFGRFEASWVDTQSEAGDYYQKWLSYAAAQPNVVGLLWFEYRDQPVTGRGPGSGSSLVFGEHYAFGLVDVGDTPKWDLVEKIRTANLRADSERLSSSH